MYDRHQKHVGLEEFQTHVQNLGDLYDYQKKLDIFNSDDRIEIVIRAPKTITTII